MDIMRTTASLGQHFCRLIEVRLRFLEKTAFWRTKSRFVFVVVQNLDRVTDFAGNVGRTLNVNKTCHLFDCEPLVLVR